MNDAIIAVIPAPENEELVAEGPSVAGCTPERPMLVWQCGCGRWGHFGCAELIQHAMSRPRALVLHAPGGPRLGMVRAMEALGVIDCWCITDIGSEEWRVFIGTPDYEEGIRQPNMLPPPAGVAGAGWRAHRAYAAAHLLHQRGLASEVLVLPVPA